MKFKGSLARHELDRMEHRVTMNVLMGALDTAETG